MEFLFVFDKTNQRVIAPSAFDAQHYTLNKLASGVNQSLKIMRYFIFCRKTFVWHFGGPRQAVRLERSIETRASYKRPTANETYSLSQQ